MEPIRKGEKQLMDIFWNAEKPLTSVELAERTGGSMSVGNLHRLLQKLEKNGYIAMCGVERATKHLIRQFAPKITREEYLSALIERETPSDYAAAKFGLALLGNFRTKQTEEERKKLIEELEAMIEEYKNQEE